MAGYDENIGEWLKAHARPLGDKLFVELVPQEKETESMIVYKTTIPRSRFAKVLAVGPDVSGINPNDTVIIGKTLGMEEADNEIIIVSQKELSGYLTRST